MAGIISYGAYIPFYRLSRKEIGKAWGKGGGAGEKAVAGGDEDTITMAVEACYDSLNDMDADKIDRLYFASTTPPYVEKQSASIISAALNLRKDIHTVDIGHSNRGGTSGLTAALDAVAGGNCNTALVAASDGQVAPGDSPKELVFGDGAAALVVGDTDVAVSIEKTYSITSEFMDAWRLPQDRHSQEWEDRFVRDKGYLRILPEAVAGFMQKHGKSPKDFDRVVYNAPNGKT
ncbi:MAG: hydroxymethylglutaryl-CoA synthase family protein, partial [Gammaproteobacteria bacterium]|nr:hydroxymethylglutaryl-CoA synthase family protein [Gammaproteobacteria bacterium]